MKPDIELLEAAFAKVLELLLLDLKDDNLKETPKRLAKMYSEELFKGMYYSPPDIKVFENLGSTFLYTKVPFKSTCAHHFQPVSGVCHIMVDYRKGCKVMGLSKFNRIVEYFACRPTLQEKLTTDVLQHLSKLLSTDINVVVQAEHHCITDRGVCASMSNTTTQESNSSNKEFLNKCFSVYKEEVL